MPPTERWVPSDSWPTIASAVENALDGTFIQVRSSHVERLSAPLIIDCNVCIEGPAQGAAYILGDENIIVAAGKGADAVFLRRLRVRVAGVPSLLLAGGCTLDRCIVESSDVGIEVAAHAGSVVRIRNCLIQNCSTGISLAGGTEVMLDGTVIENCLWGVSVTGLTIGEGWNQTLGSLSSATFKQSREANLILRAWGIRDRHGRADHTAAGRGEAVVHGWPGEACSIVTPLESGGAVLHFSGGNVNATLFEEEDAEETEEDSPGAATLDARPFRLSSTENVEHVAFPESPDREGLCLKSTEDGAE